jgi:hypothetical protein
MLTEWVTLGRHVSTKTLKPTMEKVFYTPNIAKPKLFFIVKVLILRCANEFKILHSLIVTRIIFE